MDLRANCTTTCFNHFCWNLISIWLFLPFKLFNSHLNLKGIGVMHYCFCWMHLSLPNIIIPMYIQQFGAIGGVQRLRKYYEV